MLKRYLLNQIADDLKAKMVFLGGPRQVGKTTFARKIIAGLYKNTAYYNWDAKSNRKKIMDFDWPAETNLLILDEVHKYKKWKNLVKGIYDTHHEEFNILVTGSARLDIYRKGGDSLLGRYHYFRMHPFSVAEAIGVFNHLEPGKPLHFTEQEQAHHAFIDLFTFGGFPEPFIAKDQKILRRWQNERLERLLKEDIRDVELIRDLGSLELLGSILPEKAGGLLSLNALREDLEVSHRAVAHWVDLLERFYYHYRIYPFAAKRIRSLKKEPKLYLWDWSEVADEAKRFENLVASHLLKLVHYLYDAEGYKTQLYYLRDVDGREVDFLVTINGSPWFAVEVKTAEQNISKNLWYFADRLKIPYLFQVIKSSRVDRIINKVRLISADKFLAGLI